MDKNVLTVPNLLSLLRILMIPTIVRLYAAGESASALALLIASGLTDVADGYIARRFNMVSNLGKILDPAADKLTQAAVLVCISFRVRAMLTLVLLLAVKETVLAVLGAAVIRETGVVKSAAWHGKLSTVLLYGTVGIHIALPQADKMLTHSLITLTGTAMLLSFILYLRRNISLLRRGRPPAAERN